MFFGLRIIGTEVWEIPVVRNKATYEVKSRQSMGNQVLASSVILSDFNQSHLLLSSQTKYRDGLVTPDDTITDQGWRQAAVLSGTSRFFLSLFLTLPSSLLRFFFFVVFFRSRLRFFLVSPPTPFLSPSRLLPGSPCS